MQDETELIGFDPQCKDVHISQTGDFKCSVGATVDGCLTHGCLDARIDG